MELLDWDYKVASLLISYPTELFPLFDKALASSQEQLKEYHVRGSEMVLKPNVHARLGTPKYPKKSAEQL